MKILIAIAALAVAATIETSAQPFDGWRGAARDGQYAETALLKKWGETGPELIWKTLDAGKGYSSPVVVGDKIYITGLDEAGEKEVFSAYTKDGKRLYQVAYGTPWKASYSDSRTTPTIVGDKAYVVSGNSQVVCLSTKDGSTVWTVDGVTTFGKKEGLWGTSESPLVFDGKVFFTPCGDKALMVALDAQTGKVVWQTPAIANEISSYVSPLLITHNGKKQIIMQTGTHILGINPADGVIQWKETEWIKGRSKETDGRISCNTPLYKDGKIFVCNGYDIGSFMLELNSDATTAKTIWRNEDMDTHIGGFVLVNGTIYGSNWINNNKGEWVAVDWNSGKTHWITEWTGGKSKGSIIAADGMLYCYDERRGIVGLVNPSTEKFDVVSEFRIADGDGPHWAHPVIKDGVLYIRHGAALMAYKIK